ncbi:hypothetical protein [Shewanella sp. UCD-KL21]|uniref:hypothetical protein n=1 Tax=Shewanella sp. UCD-KL21 TaxID=1917164 RepID=UPI0009710678|nr:hypothetical protein [Shewanella sp. UCD-KL21]
MPKLTLEQKRLLIWLSLTTTHFEICREVGHSYRQTNGLERYVNKHGDRYKFDMRTLNKLVIEGLVTSEILYPFGIKQEHYFVTEKGRAYAYQLRTAVS